MKTVFKQVRGVWLVVCAVSAYSLAQSVQAASFDCAKAQTRVEKLICSDAELSGLDDEMAASYKAVLQDTVRAEATKQTQKLWLKERNACISDSCVLRSYQGRLAKLNGYGYETEAQRLDAVRALIASERSPRPAKTNDQYRQDGTTAPSCNAMLQDLLAGKYQAIEPMQIRDKHDPTVREQSLDSIEVQELHGFPRVTTAKLRFCASAEAEEKFHGIEDRFFLGFDVFAGAPPFRVYRLPDAANPYRDMDFVYWSVPKTGSGYRQDYHWVNLNHCKTVFGLQTSYSAGEEKESPRTNAQAIALYRGKFSYLEAHKGYVFSIQHLEPASVRSDSTDRLGTHCRWATYPETTTNK